MILREQLAHHREGGHSFRYAWELARRDALKNVDKSHRREWSEVLDWARGEFEAAYRRAPTPSAESFDTLAARGEWGEVQPVEGTLLGV